MATLGFVRSPDSESCNQHAKHTLGVEFVRRGIYLANTAISEAITTNIIAEKIAGLGGRSHDLQLFCTFFQLIHHGLHELKQRKNCDPYPN